MTIDIPKLKALAVLAQEQNTSWIEAGRPWPIWNSCMYEMHSAASPAAVLELIAEIERLTKQWGDRPAYHTPEYERRRDAMWRRAHMVATSKGYDHINMAIAAAPKACTACMGCGGEWQGEGLPSAACEVCKGSRGKALESERDQLKAENERLELENEDTLKKFEEAVEGFTKLSAEVLDLRQQLAVPSDVLADCEALRLENEALRKLASELYRSVECSNVDHCKAEQHSYDEPCKVLARMVAVISKDSPNA